MQFVYAEEDEAFQAKDSAVQSIALSDASFSRVRDISEEFGKK
jgi:hypothetical protein